MVLPELLNPLSALTTPQEALPFESLIKILLSPSLPSFNWKVPPDFTYILPYISFVPPFKYIYKYLKKEVQMKTFRKIATEDFILQEGLSYKVQKERVQKFKNLEDYETETKGDITSYSLDNEIVFTYNTKTKKLAVLKQGWQLMNLERGF
jgi:hypothetical protein